MDITYRFSADHSMIRMKARHPLVLWIPGPRYLSMPSVPQPKLLVGWERICQILEELATKNERKLYPSTLQTAANFLNSLC